MPNESAANANDHTVVCLHFAFTMPTHQVRFRDPAFQRFILITYQKQLHIMFVVAWILYALLHFPVIPAGA
jgi:hypothetical protein